MNGFIFCMIFIQVGIFFIAAFILAASFYYTLREKSLAPARISARIRARQRRGNPAGALPGLRRHSFQTMA